MESTGGRSKFTCYFCNKTIENETEMGHTTVCASVLLPCPNRCGSYIARMHLPKHKQECVNRTAYSTINKNFPNYAASTTSYSLGRNMNGGLAYSPDNITTAPNFQEELSNISRRLNNFEQMQLRDNQNQQLESLKNAHMQQKLEVEKTKYQNQVVMEWKKTIEFNFVNFKQQLNNLQKMLIESDSNLKKIQATTSQMEKMQMDINYILDSFYREQTVNHNAQFEINDKISAFKDSYIEDNATMVALWNDQKHDTDIISKDLELVKNAADELKMKHSNIVFDVRAVSQIASEAAEKIEIQEREFDKLKKDVNQMKLDLELLNDSNKTSGNIVESGKLLWKITQVQSKLENAKELDNVLKSPIFYSHEYGYKIRILVFLNGLKKWKDRYALLSIHVLKGEYDLLLKWPCQIDGSVTLKDLENVEEPKPFSKYIVAKRESGNEETEEPQESSSSYIFIPHTVLFKEKHNKEDTIFLEVSINNKRRHETTF